MRVKNLFITAIILFLLTVVVTVCGIGSFDTGKAYDFTNQYGDLVRIWGAGIYARDSYFMAPIFIGTDLVILVMVVPLAIRSYYKLTKEETVENLIQITSLLGVLLYYATSISFGVTYNQLHLVYIFLFGICFFGVGIFFLRLHRFSVMSEGRYQIGFSGGMKTFILLSGIALFVAWLPDIVISLIQRSSLGLIEVYTTSVTNVLDMGILSPMLFLTYFLLHRENFMGYVLFRMLLTLCKIIGIMLPVQTAFQMGAGIVIPTMTLITKVLIFVLLAGFATFFEHQLKRQTNYNQINKII